MLRASAAFWDPTLIGGWAGDTQEDKNSPIQPDEVLVSKTADMAAEFGFWNSGNLVHHQPAGSSQSVFRARLDD
jgi:hypothetical protein